ncbi:MAG: hypothetical protein AB1700_06660, partial [Bacillota bacterium]
MLSRLTDCISAVFLGHTVRAAPRAVHKRARRIAGVLAISLVCGLCSVATAQVSISLSPLLVELVSAPGSTETFDIALVNNSKYSSAHFRVFAADVVQRQNGDYQVIESGDPQYSCA